MCNYDLSAIARDVDRDAVSRRARGMRGLVHDCGRIVAEQREGLGAFDLSTLVEPYRLEGKKMMGLEICEPLGRRVPDVVVYPTGGGTGVLEVYRAIEQLSALGWLREARQPRFVVIHPARGDRGHHRLPQAGACAAAIESLRRSGWIKADDELLTFNTGAGTKYVELLPPLPPL